MLSGASGLYGYYPMYDDRAEVRVLVTPKEAAVYVDGFYAGIVDDFNGFFQRLPVPPGEHDVVLYLDGYRTVHQRLYLAPGSTHKLRDTMEKLPPGEPSEPPPAALPAPPGPPAGAVMAPWPPQRGRMPPVPFPVPGPSGAPPETTPPGDAAGRSEFGTLALRVQPGDADVTIDGEHWSGADGGERLIVQVVEGSHHVEVRRAGYRTFSTDIEVRRDQTSPLNVSLSPERP